MYNKEKGRKILMKKLREILGLFLVTVLLTGCVKMNMTIDVKSEEEIDFGIEYIFNETMLSQYGDGEDISSQMKEMEDELKSQMQKEIPGVKDIKTKVINKEIDGAKWAGIEMSMSVTGQEAKTLCKMEGDKLVLDLSSLANEMGDSGDIDELGMSVESLKTYGMEMNIVVNMPDTPTTTYGTVEGKTVTIDLLQMMADSYNGEIVVTANQKSSSSMMPIILGGVITVVVIVAVVFGLKKKKKTEEPLIETTEEPVLAPQEESVEEKEEVVETKEEDTKEEE